MQKIIDFVMTNKSFFAFVAALAGYVISKIKAAGKDAAVKRQASALDGVARAVEDFQEQLNQREPLVLEDPKALKKAIAYNVSSGREELDQAIARMSGKETKRDFGLARAAAAAVRIVLP